MNAVFVELPPFERHRSRYLDDEGLGAQAGRQFWLFTLYDKGQNDDLTRDQRAALRALLDAEVSSRAN